MERPIVRHATLVRGIIEGPIRCEALDGSELWLPPRRGIMSIPPFTVDGKTYCVSHLQKKAKYFSLKFDPAIYHWGYFWHLQEQDENGNWKPGTEKGLYWRTWGWRWQVPDANSEWTPWIWSWGRGPGMHLD